MPTSFQKHMLCWGILYRMLGLTDRSKISLSHVKEGNHKAYFALAQNALKYNPRKNDLPHDDLLVEAAKLTSKILMPRRAQMSKLALECDAGGQPKLPSGKARDDKNKGYSRDAFKRIEKKDVSDDIAVAIICYLLRGFALFYCRPRGKRDFNAAKVTLNDFYQAFQLSWRLYHSLGCNHHRSPGMGLEEYLGEVIQDADGNSAPGRSPYFIWNCFLLCEIMRGNVYKQIDYIEESDRYYRHAESRFHRLRQHLKKHPDNNAEPDNSLDKREDDSSLAGCFISPTFISAMFERSNVLFDLGQILESLIIQIRCLDFLILRKQAESNDSSEAPGKLRSKFKNITKFLEAERSVSTFDREMVTYYFGGPWAKPTSWEEDPKCILKKGDLRIFCKYVTREMAQLATEIFARMGFILYCLRPRMIARRQWKEREKQEYRDELKKHRIWLKSYFRLDLIWGKVFRKEINARKTKELEPSHFGLYSETLFRGANADESAFDDEVERKFALTLRQAVRRIPQVGIELNEKDFYKAILSTTTRNIDNIVTIPRRNRRLLMRRGYIHRRRFGDLSQEDVVNGLKIELGLSENERHKEKFESSVANKLVVLRRWQSYNPIIPHSGKRRLRGGGYFLLWQGRGIVIDPGYDFIQNFYDEGFSLEDIDAVIVTHSHPDHDNDFANLITLIKEWNEFHEKTGNRDLVKKLDIFLNETVHWKFSSWLQASDVKIGCIISLPVVWWDKDSDNPSEGPFRGKNVIIDLCPQPATIDSVTTKPYNMKIEVIPAWHDDVISKTSAVGLKFYLYNKAGTIAGIVGYTGDTGAYGLDIQDNNDMDDAFKVNNQFRDCDILIAHLGDIRIRELMSVMETNSTKWATSGNIHPLLTLLESWFKGVPHKNFTEKVQDYMNFVITLDLVPSEALRTVIVDRHGRCSGAVQKWLGKYLEGSSVETFSINPAYKLLEGMFEFAAKELGKTTRISANYATRLRGRLLGVFKHIQSLNSRNHSDHRAFILLWFLTICSQIHWQYRYHLGIFGIYKLFKTMAENAPQHRKNKIFVVGELPEELASYRHWIARWLNIIEENLNGNKQRVHAFTGDIGLHIGLSSKNRAHKIRCTYCNYNNETVCRKETYHLPGDILEIPVPRLQSAMIYLCKKKDHHPEDPDRPRQYPGSPHLRVI